MGERLRGGGRPPAPAFPITPRTACGAAGAAAWNIAPPAWPKPRVVRFSWKRTLGTLYVKTASVFGGPTMFGRSSVRLDPTGKGKAVVRLGAGVFYGRALLRTLDDFCGRA